MHICHSELELEWLDLTINAKNSACMRIGPRSNVICSNITTKAGHEFVSPLPGTHISGELVIINRQENELVH